MNKIKVGALAVSRYHQIQRFFPVDDAPNVPDHDFPVPGYLLIPSGYMRLVKKPSPTGNAVYLEGEDMTGYRDDGLNDACTSAHEDHGQHHGHESSHHSSCPVTLPPLTVSTTLHHYYFKYTNIHPCGKQTNNKPEYKCVCGAS